MSDYEFDVPDDMLYIWDGEDASDEEKREWRGLRKLLTVPHEKVVWEQFVREIYSETELKELKLQLISNGWYLHNAANRLTLWKKLQSN